MSVFESEFLSPGPSGFLSVPSIGDSCPLAGENTRSDLSPAYGDNCPGATCPPVPSLNREGTGGQRGPDCATDCPGWGAVSALVDRLTVAAEELESTLAAHRAATYQTDPWGEPNANPDGVPETNTEEK